MSSDSTNHVDGLAEPAGFIFPIVAAFVTSEVDSNRGDCTLKLCLGFEKRRDYRPQQRL